MLELIDTGHPICLQDRWRCLRQLANDSGLTDFESVITGTVYDSMKKYAVAECFCITFLGKRFLTATQQEAKFMEHAEEIIGAQSEMKMRIL